MLDLGGATGPKIGIDYSALSGLLVASTGAPERGRL